MRYDDSKMAGNSSQKHICFCGCMVSGSFTCDAHVGFKVVNCSFYAGSYLIKINPFRGVPLDTWKHTELHVFVGISSSAFLYSGTGIWTVTYSVSFYHTNFRTAPFDTVRTSFFFRDSAVFHGERGIIGAGRITVFIEANFFEGAFIAGIIRDQRFLETEVIAERTINVN